MVESKVYRALKEELSANDILYSALFGVEKLLADSGAQLIDRDGAVFNNDIRAKYVGSIARIVLRVSEKYGAKKVLQILEHPDFKQYFGGKFG